MLRPAVFLDRDGVLNGVRLDDAGKPHPPRSVSELVLLPDVAVACQRLRTAGYGLAVVTNQPDVGRGAQTRESVEAINAALGELIPVEAFLVCYHDDADACSCRKPKPGLLVEGARLIGADLHQSWMVGDRWRDIGAGRNAGCRTVQVGGGYDEDSHGEIADLRASSLAAAVDRILECSARLIAKEG